MCPHAGEAIAAVERINLLRVLAYGNALGLTETHHK